MHKFYDREIFYGLADQHYKTTKRHGEHWSELFYQQARKDGFKWATRRYYPSCCTGFESATDLVAADTEQEIYKVFDDEWGQKDEYDPITITDDKEQVIKFKTNWVMGWIRKL